MSNACHVHTLVTVTLARKLKEWKQRSASQRPAFQKFKQIETIFDLCSKLALERCIKAGTLTVNYEKVDIDYKLKHNDLLANIVHSSDESGVGVKSVRYQASRRR
ncbi:hypothetical protein RUM43_009388 [Polyplax serrata]|uniref:RNA-binding S4 domain-containing protein n=1 Tax=Polyplax serrata TaxID=468196 RepID=A0AAN8S155_POLSC